MESVADAGGNAILTVLSSHASRWNMGLPTSAIGEAPFAQDDTYLTPFHTALTADIPGATVLITSFEVAVPRRIRHDECGVIEAMKHRDARAPAKHRAKLCALVPVCDDALALSCSPTTAAPRVFVGSSSTSLPFLTTAFRACIDRTLRAWPNLATQQPIRSDLARRPRTGTRANSARRLQGHATLCLRVSSCEGSSPSALTDARSGCV